MSARQKLRISLSMIYAVFLWGAIFIWNSLHHSAPDIPGWVVVYTLGGLLLLVERFTIPVNSRAQLELGSVYLIGFTLAYPIELVSWAGLLYGVISSVRHKRHWFAQVMNASALTMCCIFAKYLFTVVGGNGGLDATEVFPILAYGAVYFISNILLVVPFMGIRHGLQGFVTMLKAITLQFMVVYGVTVMIGLLLALVLYQSGLAGALLFTALILAISYSFRDYFKMANHFRELSVKDELTGLHNHRYIQNLMDRLITEKREFALLMMDIDHFKRYNEVWGHVRGDEALSALSKILNERRIPDEEIARYSGEEFAIVLPDYDLSQAHLKAELLRRAIEETAFPGAEKLPGKKLTVSIGVARYPDMADSKNELMVMVDDALYKGKFTGRNKVSLYTSVLDEMKRDLTMDDEEQEIVKTIKVFLAILNSKDRYTYAHTERDVLYAAALAKRMGLDDRSVRYLRFGAFLHDIGKVEIPLEVLTKRGPLTRDEWQIMKSHVELGVNITKPIQSLAPCLPIIRHHHERFDGAGYPDGLEGLNIPIEARILTIADSFDAMTTSRPYQRKRNMEDAFEELRSCAGRQFDPDLIEPFIEVVREIGLLSNEDEELA